MNLIDAILDSSGCYKTSAQVSFIRPLHPSSNAMGFVW